MIMKDICVSVVVPVYNAEKYVKKTIESLVNQSYKNIEIIIVNDGSTDSSVSICEEFKDSRIKIFNRKNEGLSASRQFGIDVAKGMYVCTIDSDDYYDCTFIEKMLRNIVENESDICICGRYDFIDGTDKFRFIKLKCPLDTIQFTEVDISNRLFELGEHYVLSDSWNKLYRTQFIRESKVVFELPKQYNGNDMAFNYKLILHCPRISVINEPLLFHRIAEGSMVHKRKNQMQEGFEVIISQIANEAAMCNLDCRRQIGVLYLKLLCQVVYNISFYSSSRYNELREYLKSYKGFISSNSNIITNYSKNNYKNFRQRVIVKCTVYDRLLLLVWFSSFLRFDNKVRGIIKRYI